MLLRAYLPSFITSLIGGLFLLLGLLTFGKPLLFDRLFIFVLLFTMLVCRKNINVVGIVAILLAVKVLDEGAWLLQNSDWVLVGKIGFYLCAALACYWAWYDKLAKLLLIVLIMSLATETYWFLAGRDSISLQWFNFMLAANLFVRDLIFSRVQYTQKLGFNNVTSTHLDWKIYSINAVTIFIILAMVIEYLLRNLLGFSNALLVYQLYPYAMQILSTFIIWSIFHESAKLLAPSLLRA